MAYLGIDCGTQSLKVLFWDPEKGETHSVSRPYGLIEGLPPGHKEQHPSTWISALQDSLEELKSQGLPLNVLQAIGVSGQQHGLVVLDERDEVIRPAKLWNDTSTSPQCEEILERAGNLGSFQAETGNSLPPGFTASKILWIRQNEPEAYRRIRSILLPHDFLNFYLTGEKVAEPGDSSGTGYFDIRRRRWSENALQWIDPETDLKAWLPTLIESSQPAGVLRAELARQWGIPHQAIVSSGGGDNMMGAIGTGNVVSGLMTVSLGTSGTIYSYSDRPVVDPKGELAAFCDSSGGWLPLGCTMNVTVATEMIRNRLLEVSHSEFSHTVEQVAPGSDGLVLIPYLEGERMPSVPTGTGVLVGLRPQTASRAHLARAAMEGVTLGLRYGLERLQSLGVCPREIRLTGGGAKSRVWRSLAADIFGVPVVCPDHEEGPAFGAALQAMWCAQGEKLAELTARWVTLNEQTHVEPSRGGVDTYNRLYGLYQSLSDALIENRLFNRHRDFIESH